MPEPVSACSPAPRDITPHAIRTEAAVALHLAALRRQFDAIREVFGLQPPHRAREAVWAALEVTLAHLRGERMALRDLVVRADGLLSGPTLSRVVSELERYGLVRAETVPGHRRAKLLRPTARMLRILMARTDAAFAEFGGILSAAEQRIAAMSCSGQGSCRSPDAV